MRSLMRSLSMAPLPGQGGGRSRAPPSPCVGASSWPRACHRRVTGWVGFFLVATHSDGGCWVWGPAAARVLVGMTTPPLVSATALPQAGPRPLKLRVRKPSARPMAEMATRSASLPATDIVRLAHTHTLFLLHVFVPVPVRSGTPSPSAPLFFFSWRHDHPSPLLLANPPELSAPSSLSPENVFLALIQRRRRAGSQPGWTTVAGLAGWLAGWMSGQPEKKNMATMN